VTLDTVAEIDPEILTADGLDNAAVGVAWVHREGGLFPVVVYDRTKTLDLLAETMGEAGAVEWFTYNIESAYVGPYTPIWVQRWDR